MTNRSHLLAWTAPALAALLVVGAPAPTASALTGREVMDKADKTNRAKDEWVQSTMHIISSSGQRRMRKLETWLKAGEGDDDKILIRFSAPADIKGTGLLTIEEGTADTQLLYLPDLRKSKRIAGANKASSFVGSDFSNYDMRTEDLQNHDYNLLGEETVGGRACHKVEALPKNAETEESTGYKRRLVYIDQERWIALKVEYFDRNGKPLKLLTASDVREVKGLWRAHAVEVENQQEGSKTQLIQEPERKINEGLDDDVFSKRNLEKG